MKSASHKQIVVMAIWLCSAVSLLAINTEPLVLFNPAPVARTVNATRGPADDSKAGVPVEINAEALQPGAVKVGDVIVVEPASGVVFTVRVSRVTTDINGTLSWTGEVAGHPNGYFLLSASEGQALGSIELPDEGMRYLLRYDMALRQHLAYSALPVDWTVLEDSPSPSPPPDTTNTYTATATPASDDVPAVNINLDVMVVYTPAARTNAGSVAAMNTIIAQAIARGQLAMDNTRIPITLRLVHASEISYVESGAALTDLYRLTGTSDGYMDNVHTLRDTYGADLVSLFEKIDDTGGIGWLLEATNGQSTFAFSITRSQQASYTYTTVHEMGHNMGCHHRRDQSTQPGPGLYSYSAGWRWIGTNSGKYASIMSYEEDSYSRVAYWSSPTNYYMGVATGTTTDDNARTIRNVKTVVAGYRTAAATNTFTFKAVALTNNVVLRWPDPTGCGAATRMVHIRYRTDQYPSATNDGTEVYTGTNLVFEHTGLTPNQPYYYTIWVSDDGETFVDP